MVFLTDSALKWNKQYHTFINKGLTVFSLFFLNRRLLLRLLHSIQVKILFVQYRTAAVPQHSRPPSLNRPSKQFAIRESFRFCHRNASSRKPTSIPLLCLTSPLVIDSGPLLPLSSFAVDNPSFSIRTTEHRQLPCPSRPCASYTATRISCLSQRCPPQLPPPSRAVATFYLRSQINARWSIGSTRRVVRLALVSICGSEWPEI